MSSQNKNELALGYVIEAFYGQSMTPNDTENNRKRLRKTSRTKQYSSMVLATIHSFMFLTVFFHNLFLIVFLRVCSRQCKNNLHIDSTYLQTYTEDNVQNTYTQYTQCTIKHTVINSHYTPYVHILHYVHICTHSNMRRCNRLYI